MARIKTAKASARFKASLSFRLREIREELFGDHGGPELARRLDLPARTWYNYETGVTIPAEALVKFIVQTGVNPTWLLSGQGPKYGHAVDTLQEIRLGRTSYPLRGPIRGQFYHEPPEVVFRVDSCPQIVGIGSDRSSALDDFQRNIHVRTQRLLATFEAAWTEQDRRDWEVLQSHLDLDDYFRKKPIKTYQRGEVINDAGDRWKVRWRDGRMETVDLQKMPDDFAAFETGEHFEAFVGIHRETKALIEMYSVHPIDPPGDVVATTEALQCALETGERVKLPHSTLDWTQ